MILFKIFVSVLLLLSVTFSFKSYLSTMMDRCVNEIKAGGVAGALGIDQIDWGGSAGAIYEIWKLEPCCGSPWNPWDAFVCFMCWHFCGLCSVSKLFGSSVSQHCSLIPHCAFMIFCGCISGPVLRYNLRKKAGAPGNIIGDIVCLYFLGPCAACQELRSVQASEWNWVFPTITVPLIVAPDPTKLIA